MRADEPSAEAARLRVMSFNVWTDHPRHPPWRERRALVAGIMRFHRPDVLGGQEFLLPMIEELARDLPVYAWVGAGREDGLRAGEFNPVFYRRDRLELLEHQTFWLAPDPALPSIGWDARCPRVVTWARLRERKSGSVFHVFNTHFDHLGARARQESARLLLRKIEAFAGPAPVLVTGDLNCRDTSAAYRILTTGEAALRDALGGGRHPPLGPRKTWRGLFNRGLGAARLDYIFVKNRVHVLQHAVLTDHGAGRRFASDHLPVAADVWLPPEKPAGSL